MKKLIKRLLKEGLENYDIEYPFAQSSVDNLVVRKDIPNTNSIDASLSDYTILKGIREVFFNQYPITPINFPFKFRKRKNL